MTEIRLNTDRQLYVIPAGNGYSCLGFDVAFNEAIALADAIATKRPDLANDAVAQRPENDDWGTLATYNARKNLIKLITEEKIDLGTWFDPKTHNEVRRLIDLAIKGKYRLRLEYGDIETGKAWDDRPINGYISRSMGPMKVPILIKNARAIGGEAVLTGSVVKISETPGGRVLWQHQTYQPYAHPSTAPAA